jgi:hypothetical protein
MSIQFLLILGSRESSITIGVSPVLSLLKFYFCCFGGDFIFRAVTDH